MGVHAVELALHYAGEREGCGDTYAHANGHEDQDFAHDQPEDFRSGSAEGHANADFAGTLGNGVGHYAVEAEDGEQRGEKAEDGGEAGDHAFGGEGVGDLHFGGAHAVDGNIGIEVAEFLANDGHEQGRIDGGAEVYGHIADVVATEVGDKGLLGDIVAKVGVLDVLDDANDFHGRGSAGIAAEADVQADGISSGEIFAGEGFVDDGGGGRPVIFFFAEAAKNFLVVIESEIAAVEDGNAEGGEVAWADAIHIRLGVLALLGGRVAFDGHGAVPFVVFENAHFREAYGLDARRRAERIG